LTTLDFRKANRTNRRTTAPGSTRPAARGGPVRQTNAGLTRHVRETFLAASSRSPVRQQRRQPNSAAVGLDYPRSRDAMTILVGGSSGVDLDFTHIHDPDETVYSAITRHPGDRTTAALQRLQLLLPQTRRGSKTQQRWRRGLSHTYSSTLALSESDGARPLDKAAPTTTPTRWTDRKSRRRPASDLMSATESGPVSRPFEIKAPRRPGPPDTRSQSHSRVAEIAETSSGPCVGRAPLRCLRRPDRPVRSTIHGVLLFPTDNRR